MSRLPFEFENNDNVAQTNAKILESNNWDLQNVIKQHEHTVFHLGTEFWAVDDLQDLLGMHKDWSKFKNNLTKGVEYGFKQDLIYTGKQCIKDLKASLE